MDQWRMGGTFVQMDVINQTVKQLSMCWGIKHKSHVVFTQYIHSFVRNLKRMLWNMSTSRPIVKWKLFNFAVKLLILHRIVLKYVKGGTILRWVNAMTGIYSITWSILQNFNIFIYAIINVISTDRAELTF